MNNKFDKYNNYREYRCGRAAVCLDGKWGFVNTCGREIVPCVYDEVTDFSTSGFARVCKEGKWGFINREGRETVQCLYDAAEDMSGGFACVCLAGRWGLIWSNGEELLPCKYDEAEYTGTDSIARVRKGDKWGLVKDGIIQIVDFKYDSICDFDLFGQMAVVELDGKYGLVNDEGDEIVPCIYEDVNDELGYDMIDLKLNGEWRTINAFGEEIAPRKIEKK